MDVVFVSTHKAIPSRYELYGYNDYLQLAVEFDEEHHHAYVHCFEDRSEWCAVLLRDMVKKEECKILHIKLINVPDDCDTFAKVGEFLVEAQRGFKYTVADQNSTAMEKRFDKFHKAGQAAALAARDTRDESTLAT